MADATQKLQIKLTGDSAGARAEIGATERDLKRLPDAAAAVNKESRAAAGGLRELAGSVAALVGGGLAVEQFIAANREASRLRASLNVLTGDAQTTAAVWRTLQAEFGASIGVEAAAAAFQKLKALGLSAGTETIRSYSNTAAAMGKSTQDFVEAVADAVTGEFERLKEFGIKAAADGDKVKITFQGVTTSISNSAAAIEQYLVSIGSHQFGSALAEQAQTLDGAFGRVENSARQLWQALGDTGAAAALASGLNAGAEALDALRQQIGDGSLFAGLAESAEQSGAVAAQSIESLGVSLAGVQYAATETGRVIAEAIPEGVRFAAEALAELPLNLRTATGIMLGELDKFGADANAVWENVKLGVSIAWSATTNVVIESTDRMRRALSGVAESAARALAGALGVEGASFGFEGGVGDRTTDRTQEFEQRRAQIAAERTARQDAADAAVAGSLAERDAARTAAAEQAALAEGDRRRSRALRDASDRERFRAAASAGASSSGAGAGGGKSGGKSEAEKSAEQLEKSFERQNEQLQKQIALFGDTTHAAELRYETEKGALQGLSAAQKADLIARAQQLDALEQQKRLSADVAAAAKKLADDAVREQERQVESITRVVERGTEGMADAFVEFALTGKASFADLARSVVGDLMKIYIQSQIIKPLVNSITGGGSIGSLISGLFGSSGSAGDFGAGMSLSGPVVSATVHHTGGLAGAGLSRSVPAIGFAGAPRYHTGGIAGFAPDEVPAILQRGEEVLPRTDPRHRDYAGAGGVTVSQSITIDARGADAGAEARIRAALDQYRRQTVADILQSLQRGGAFARATGRA